MRHHYSDSAPPVYELELIICLGFSKTLGESGYNQTDNKDHSHPTHITNVQGLLCNTPVLFILFLCCRKLGVIQAKSSLDPWESTHMMDFISVYKLLGAKISVIGLSSAF